MLTLENAEAGAGVELGQNPSARRAALQFDCERNSVCTSVVVMKGIECEGVGHALTSLRTAMRPHFEPELPAARDHCRPGRPAMSDRLTAHYRRAPADGSHRAR